MRAQGVRDERFVGWRVSADDKARKREREKNTCVCARTQQGQVQLLTFLPAHHPSINITSKSERAKDCARE